MNAGFEVLVNLSGQKYLVICGGSERLELEVSKKKFYLCHCFQVAAF
jgi:hypothetical protein